MRRRLLPLVRTYQVAHGEDGAVEEPVKVELPLGPLLERVREAAGSKGFVGKGGYGVGPVVSDSEGMVWTSRGMLARWLVDTLTVV